MKKAFVFSALLAAVFLFASCDTSGSGTGAGGEENLHNPAPGTRKLPSVIGTWEETFYDTFYHDDDILSQPWSIYEFDNGGFVLKEDLDYDTIFDPIRKGTWVNTAEGKVKFTVTHVSKEWIVACGRYYLESTPAKDWYDRAGFLSLTGLNPTDDKEEVDGVFCTYNATYSFPRLTEPVFMEIYIKKGPWYGARIHGEPEGDWFYYTKK